MPDAQDVLLLGIDHSTYGAYELRELGPDLACVISVGGNPRPSSLQFKADRKIPNEDALLVFERDGSALRAEGISPS